MSIKQNYIEQQVDIVNFKENESQKKLMGSYYTPEWIATFVAKWIANYQVKTVLEPSCGDGIFIDAVFKNAFSDGLKVYAFDTDPNAIENCLKRECIGKIDSSIYCSDYLEWVIKNIKSDNPLRFDAVVGNPPFIRYQYLEKEQQENAQEIFDLLGLKFTKHTNAWIPFVISAIEFLIPGGIIGMVIPAELLHVLYAQGLREYLLKACSRVLLLDPEDLWFEDTLQGAMLLMAQKKNDKDEQSFVSIKRTKGRAFSMEDPVYMFNNADYLSGKMLERKWTYALLTKQEFEAYNRVCKSKSCYRFKSLADVDVGIVTGANKYFLVTDETVKAFDLKEVAHPMFGRSEHCPGVVYNQEQHDKNANLGLPTNFLYFDEENQDKKYEEYIKLGEEQEIHLRYKCRIRKPWYKVPSVFASPVGMLKRSNGMPRLILNTIGAYTTDTAYRISPKEWVDGERLVFCFINTITALSAELEGRFYGGGVLELVPSEIERMVIPYCDSIKICIDDLNRDIQIEDCDYILQKQDTHIFSECEDIDMGDIELLRVALKRLQLRRQRMEEE